MLAGSHAWPVQSCAEGTGTAGRVVLNVCPDGHLLINKASARKSDSFLDMRDSTNILHTRPGVERTSSSNVSPHQRQEEYPNSLFFIWRFNSAWLAP